MTSITFPNPNATNKQNNFFWTWIAEEIAQAISNGLYPPGARLPSEHALAEQFRVNRHTIRRSLASLSGQGLVRTAQGSGTYVEDFAVELMLSKRTRHHQNLLQAGLKGGLKVLLTRTESATQKQAAALKIPLHSQILVLDILGLAKGQALHVSERAFPLPRFQGLDAVVAQTASITAAFSAAGVSDYTRQESRISTHMPAPLVANHLRQPLNSPVLRVESINIDNAGIPVEYAITWFAGDRVTLTVNHSA